MANRLTTAEAAKLAGIAPASLRRARERGTFPPADGYDGRSPYWLRSTVERALATRRGAGRPRLPDCPGSGKRWVPGFGAAICPACYRGPRGLRVPPPSLRAGRWLGTVPAHPWREP
jgi:hypothetical protein